MGYLCLPLPFIQHPPGSTGHPQPGLPSHGAGHGQLSSTLSLPSYRSSLHISLLHLGPGHVSLLSSVHSVDNKFGHTQKPEDTCGDNFHADHHLLHVKNYGIYNCLLDMYFIMPTLYCPGGKNLVYQVEKKLEEEKTVFI